MGFLFDVSENRVSEVGQGLMSGKYDANCSDSTGNTALHLAAEKVSD